MLAEKKKTIKNFCQKHAPEIKFAVILILSNLLALGLGWLLCINTHKPEIIFEGF